MNRIRIIVDIEVPSDYRTVDNENVRAGQEDPLVLNDIFFCPSSQLKKRSKNNSVPNKFLSVLIMDV